jgi:hypothetical protein
VKLAAVGILALSATAYANPAEHFDPTQGGSIVEPGVESPTSLVDQRPIDLMVQVPLDDRMMAQAPTPNSNVIFLNSCRPNGCRVGIGDANSINDTWGIDRPSTLTPFDGSDADWADVVSCMKEVFEPFNIVITDTDPGTANHFEIMVAGAPQDLGMSSGIGGISPWNCDAPGGYISDSLVFDFSKVWGGSVNEICATAAQEVAHSFLLDHVADASDPMTYFSYPTRRHFKDGVMCGSDCVNGRGPFGQSCNGADDQIHSCTCTGHATQADVTDIKNLFGASTVPPPEVKISNPLDGSAVMGAFPVGATVTGNLSPIVKADLVIDGATVSSLTAAPFGFNAPGDLASGSHEVKVVVHDYYDVQGSTTIHVIIGSPCTSSSDCPDDGDACVGGRCITGPGVDGGLGSTCTMDSDCASNQCVASDSGMYCVVPCDVGMGECPSGFGCYDTGGGAGICYPGYDDGTGGGGGCTSGGGGATLLGVLFGLAGLVWKRRS